MSERDNLIQLMAKAHLSYGRHPALRSPVPMQGDIDAMSDALAALEAAGVRLVPSEPSRHMLLAAHMVESDDIELTEDEHRAIYAAFVAASPYAPPGG